MNEPNANEGTFALLGGRLCLDFANTADWHATEHPVEFLTGYAELASWSVHVGILTEELKQRLLERAARHPSEADAVLRRAILLREAVYRIFAATSHRLEPQAADLQTFNDELSVALSRSGIVLTKEGFDWGWTDSQDALDRMLSAVVHDTADLLTSGELGRVGQCADSRCGWLFLDKSRNRSRRWCSMEYCGNRAKARRHYQRSQTS